MVVGGGGCSPLPCLVLLATSLEINWVRWVHCNCLKAKSCLSALQSLLLAGSSSHIHPRRTQLLSQTNNYLGTHTYIWISYTFFSPYLFVHTQYMRSRREKKHKPNQTQPFMLCFLPQSLSVKPTSGCSINVLFKEREFPRSVYLQCLRPCGRVAF